MKHLSKRAGSADHAAAAVAQMEVGLESLAEAERQLALSGYRGAAHGVHQAAARVVAWVGKVKAEIAPQG